MTAWQDESDQQRRDGGAARPGSRRAAREAERRAETMLEKPPHPSGVVDFEARDFGGHDFGSEFAPDQDFSVGDTQDIWQALSRGRQAATPPQSAPQPQPAAPTAAEDGDRSALSGELLDRVRDAVLRRSPEASLPTVRMPQAPEPAAPRAVPAPQQADPRTYDRRTLQPRPEQEGVSRRQRRIRETADLREDGLPAELFVDRGPAPAPQAAWEQPAAPQPTGFEGADYEDDGYYDEPYAPEPTIAIPAVPAARAASGAVSIPQGFAEPAGDDRLTFSSPIEQVAAHPHDPYEVDDAEPAFLAPEDRWDDDEDDEWEAAPAPTRAAAQPVFQNPQLGPPSEATDLAGFEALIRKARQQPAEPQQAPRTAAFAWADDEEVQEGFTGLLSRQVQGSHGSSNALILPTDPQQVDVTQAVNGDGDIFRTGTMKLSRSLSTTGMADDVHDAPELDRLSDTGWDEPAAGVEPVRASRAVSGTGPNRAIVSGHRTRGNLLPTVLAVVAGAMAVGVVTLLVGSWLFKIF